MLWVTDHYGHSMHKIGTGLYLSVTDFTLCEGFMYSAVSKSRQNLSSDASQTHRDVGRSRSVVIFASRRR